MEFLLCTDGGAMIQMFVLVSFSFKRNSFINFKCVEGRLAGLYIKF